MLTLVFCFVAVVAIVKTFDTAPAGIKTVAGTFARVELLLVRFTTMPPAGAALLRVTVPVAAEPPTIVEGLSVNDDNAAGTGGLTVRVADLLAPE
jgi:hypothetical protein